MLRFLITTQPVLLILDKKFPLTVVCLVLQGVFKMKKREMVHSSVRWVWGLVFLLGRSKAWLPAGGYALRYCVAGGRVLRRVEATGSGDGEQESNRGLSLGFDYGNNSGAHENLSGCSVEHDRSPQARRELGCVQWIVRLGQWWRR